jgi:acyl-CoA thioester hydrolase
MYRTRIYYQDTDAGRVVYFANFLRFFEKSWFERLLGLGISLPEWERAGVFAMVKTVRLDLKEKLHYGDEIETATSVAEVKNAQFSMRHRVRKGDRVIAEGETLMVCVDGSGRVRRLPAEWKARLTLSSGRDDF